MINLPDVVKLIESAFKKLPMHEENVDAVAGLDDLQRKITVILEILAADQRTILRMRPSGKGRVSIH